MKKTLLLFFLVLFLSISSVSAFSTSLDEVSYRPADTAVLTITTTTGAEKGDAHTVEWFNGTVIVETDTGNLSNIIGGNVFETLIIPITAQWPNAYVNITVGVTTQQILFNVSGNTTNQLEINNASFSAMALLGNIFAIDFRVRHLDTLTEVNNAHCTVYGTDVGGAPLQECGIAVTHSGRGVCSDVLDSEVFLESTQYLAKLKCNCGIGDNACFDEFGQTIEKHYGDTTFVFEIDPWLFVNTITDKTSYTLEDKEILVCANITNIQQRRLSLHINYNYRCDGDDLDNDRIIVDSHDEFRGVNGNLTQNQCARLSINNFPSMQNKVNRCYAATDVKLMTLDGETAVFTYLTTSPEFNITSNSLVDTSEVNDMTASISITVFILIVSIFLYLLPFMKKQFSKTNPVTDLILRRSCWVLTLILMAFNSAIIATIAEAGGIDLTSEMFRYMWLFGWGCYLMSAFMVIGTLFEGFNLWREWITTKKFSLIK